MRLTTATALIAATLVVATLPMTAAAGVTLGANIGTARLNQGDFDDDDTTYKLHVGTSFREIIGGEIGYVDFGDYNLGGSTRSGSAWAPALTVGVPLGAARLYGKGGIAFAEVEGANLNQEFDSRNEDPFYGVGLRIGMDRGLGFRAEYERYQVDDEDLDMAMAGLEVNF